MNTPAFVITFLGVTEKYEVHDIQLYVNVVVNPTSRDRYKNALWEIVHRVKKNGQRAWLMFDLDDLNDLSQAQRASLFYQVVLPFTRAPITSRTYNTRADADVGNEQDNSLARRILQSAFNYKRVGSREAALPPGFVPTTPLQPTDEAAP